MREATSLGKVDNAPSPRLWHNCPWHAIQQGTRRGIAFFDDFINVPLLSADADTGLYASYIDTGNTITQIATADTEWGVVEIATDTTDNDEAWMGTGGNSGVLARFFKEATAVPHEIWFEARFALNEIASGNMFVGFALQGNVGADFITDTGAMKDTDLFGFQVLEDDVDGLDVTYKASGQTVQVPLSVAHTMVANTFVKAGFHYNPLWPPGHKIAIYIDNDKEVTKITKTNIDAATFPSGVEMALIAGVKNSTTTAHKLAMDWWKFAMLELA